MRPHNSCTRNGIRSNHPSRTRPRNSCNRNGLSSSASVEKQRGSPDVCCKRTPSGRLVGPCDAESGSQQYQLPARGSNAVKQGIGLERAVALLLKSSKCIQILETVRPILEPWFVRVVQRVYSTTYIYEANSISTPPTSIQKNLERNEAHNSGSHRHYRPLIG